MPRRSGIVALVLAASACVSMPADHDPMTLPEGLGLGVVIPIGEPVDESQRPLMAVYQSVLEQMQEAYGGRVRGTGQRRHPDLPALRDLLATWRRPDIPVWAREQIEGYAAAAEGLAFELHAVGNGKVVPQVDDGIGDEIGEPLRLQVELPAAPTPYELRGGEATGGIAFTIALEVEDLFVDGSSRQHEDSTVVRLPEDLALTGDAVLRLPFLVELTDTGAVRRTVRARADLLPGFVYRDGLRCPLRRTTVTAVVHTQYPAGFASIRQKPLQSLRAGIALGDAAHFPHVLLGALFTQGDERQAAQAALIDVVRLGRPDQAHVAMAALRQLTGVEVTIGDREGWLAWWQARQ